MARLTEAIGALVREENRLQDLQVQLMEQRAKVSRRLADIDREEYRTQQQLEQVHAALDVLAHHNVEEAGK